MKLSNITILTGLRCPIECACRESDAPLGSRPLNEYGFCEHFCSKPTSEIDRIGVCGRSWEYMQDGSTDCRGCKGRCTSVRYILNSIWEVCNVS